jgi:hypothetical protein
MTTYAKIIEKAKRYAAANPPRVDHLSLEDLHEAVGMISSELKHGNVGAADRLIMNEDRKVYRAEIARRTA